MDIEMTHLLPHGAGMHLIDHVTSSDKNTIACSTRSHLRNDHPLAVNGKLPMMALIEYAAQAAGLHIGLSQHDAIVTEASALRYIGGLSDVHFFSRVLPVDEITITAKVLVRAERNVMYSFEIRSPNECIAHGRLSLAWLVSPKSNND